MKQEWNKAIAIHYGTNDRVRLLMEECGELVQASNKILRYPDSHKAWVNLLEEMVDVSIMIAQVRALFNYGEPEWNYMEQYKINRCKKRFMEDKYYANRTKGKWWTAQTDNTAEMEE